MPTQCTLEEAAQYIQRQAENLIILNTLAPFANVNYNNVKRDSAANFKAGALQPRNKAYLTRKQRAGGGMTAGVLSGALMRFRTFATCDYWSRKKGNSFFCFPAARDLTAEEQTMRRRGGGGDKTSDKPWPQYPHQKFSALKLNIEALAVPNTAGENADFNRLINSLPIKTAVYKKLMSGDNRLLSVQNGQVVPQNGLEVPK